MKHLFTIMCFISLLSLSFYAKDTVSVASDVAPNEGGLNTAIEAAKTAGTLSSTVFKLEPFGYYVISGSVVIPQGETLEIDAPAPGTTQATAPPQIMWTSSGGVTTDFMFECDGDIILKNVWLRYATTSGAQVGSVIEIVDDPVSNASGKGEIAQFDGVIFDYSECPSNAGGAVSVTAQLFKGSFKNCYFKNCIDSHLRYYGRAVSFPYNTTAWHTDSLWFENCTFANMGYVLMQEGNEYSDKVYFNHCTFYNIMEFPLESGWWNKCSVTNSVFVNPFMYGQIPAQTGTGDPNGATMRIDSIANFGFTVPFTEQDRHILFANNSCSNDPWLVDWMANCPYSKTQHQQRNDDQIPMSQPMLSPNTLVFMDSVDAVSGKKVFPYINEANNFNGSDPGLKTPPLNLDSLKLFLNCKWDTNCDHNWSYKPSEGLNQTWPLSEDLSYTNDTLLTAAMNKYPLGDLYHWFPAKYTQWAAQASKEHTNILSWVYSGTNPTAAIKDAGKVTAASYKLGQNYPNPFNPTTKIDYTVAKAGNVSLVVYNLLGQKVVTLFDGMRAAGSYTANFNASKLSSGIYVYQLKAGDVTISKKLVLMK